MEKLMNVSLTKTNGIGRLNMCAINILVFVFISTKSVAQDSLAAFHELAKLRQIYERLPVQIDIDIRNSATPITSPEDTLGSSMRFYFGLKDIYLEAEGIEEIVNDSLVIIVNNPAKQITISPSTPEVMQKIKQSASMFLPASSIQALSERYTSSARDIDSDKRKLIFQSRETYHGRKQAREIISTIYEKSSYQPIEIEQVKLKPVLIDSVFYAKFVSEKMYNGKLNKAVTARGNLFFLTKELKTTYRVAKIEYNVLNPPVRQQHRVSIDENGEYTPAKGYDEYLITREF